MTDSAGLVLWRRREQGSSDRWSGERVEHDVEILLVHPGGPFWAKKDEHAWSIPKGEFDPDTESSFVAARREFAEELGRPAPDIDFVELGSFRAGSKRIHAWMGHSDFDVSVIKSNHFEMEWPPRSSEIQSFPEIDRAAWIPIDQAHSKLHKGQSPLLARIRDQLG